MVKQCVNGFQTQSAKVICIIVNRIINYIDKNKIRIVLNVLELEYVVLVLVLVLV